jgi:riboflavin kinase
LPILLELARLDAHVASRRLTSAELARRLATSQQTAARWLVELEREGLIKREAGPRGQSVRLTSTGLAIIRSVYHDLDAIFRARARVLKLVGRVTSGIGEGSYYVCQEGYRRQFKRVLGFDPYPGTLDLKLDEESLELKGVLQSMPGKHIEGFITPERTFGPVKCFSAKLRGVKVAIVIPSRTHLTDAIELIAPKNLRKKLGLKDGDRVKLEVRV